MTLQESLTRHFSLVYDTAEMNLEDMSAEQSLVQPPGGGNCANWILGHLVSVHNSLMQLLGEEPVWFSPQLDRAGFEPIQEPADAINWGALTSRFLESRERCLAAVARQSDEGLAEEIDDPFGAPSTRAALLTLLAFHQTYHVGQLGVLRRIAGLPNAIKGPGQERA